MAEGDISRTREPRVLLVHSTVKANRPFRVPLAYVDGGIDVLGVLASLSRQLRRLVKLSILKRGKVPNISETRDLQLRAIKFFLLKTNN